jgi:exodeoxyribonuclease VII large subunit
MRNHPSITGGSNNLPVFTVGELSLALRRHIEDRFDVLRVKGELSGCKRHASGHLYFTLKDQEACLDGVCWRNAAAALAIRPEDGLEVIATGRLTTYPGRSKYQMVVERMEIAGQGALLKLLEDRKRTLAEEGLFDPARRPPVPFLPDVVGVVTSPSGAVIRDILHRLADRFPRPVLLWPVAVQGPGAAEQIAQAIAGFNRLPAKGEARRQGEPTRPDVLIVARGGGSLEDLWAFNEEIVVRAAAASAIPLIAAVGHETDNTLIDLAAARRAPTPSAAAEMVVPVRLDLMARVLALGSSLASSVNRTVSEQRTRVIAAGRGLPQPERVIGEARQRLDDKGERLANALVQGIGTRRRQLAVAVAGLTSPRHRVSQAEQRLAGEGRALAAALQVVLRDRQTRMAAAASLLESFSYQRTLDRGFALVYDRFGRLLTTIADLRPRLPIRLRLGDGEATATVDTPTRRRDRAGVDQETLL